MPSDTPLRRVLRERGLSQSRLARQLDMNESLLSHYMAGRRNPPDDFYPRLALLLGVSEDSLRPEEPVAA